MLAHRERSRTTLARSPARRSAGGAKALPLAGRRQILVGAAPPQPIGCLPGERDVGKNILIFSDGTGQRGGLQFDEPRSNIYKLYRATRCGPDSSVDPSEQLTFYDPGLGTLPGGLGLLGAMARRIYNLVSQATGLGITANIIDCDAAAI